MGLFGKAKIAQLEAEIAQERARADRMTAEVHFSQNRVEYLVRTIRDMDQLIFNMSQCTSWESMRPYFTALNDGVTSRKVAESNRINDMLRPELIKTYSDQTSAKPNLGRSSQITKQIGKPRE